MTPDRVARADLAAFEAGTIDNAAFHHVDHLRVAHEMLGRYDFGHALARYSSGLRSIAARAGNPGAYHATVTAAFLALVAERRYRDASAPVERFIRQNADLLDRDCLTRWYDPDHLASAVARHTFVLPHPLRPSR
jgi:hypothetical protein